MFFHREKGVCDRLMAEEQLRAMGEWLHEELASQLATARQEVAKLAPVRQELSNLWIKYVEAHDDTREAREKLLDLIKIMCMDVVEIEQLQKERDDLLQAVEGFRTERDLAHQERADAQQRINLLEGELQGEKDLKVAAEAVTTRLIMEVSQR